MKKYYSIQVVNREHWPDAEGFERLKQIKYPATWRGKLGCKLHCGMMNWLFKFAAKKNRPIPPLPQFVPVYNEEASGEETPNPWAGSPDPDEKGTKINGE